MVHIGKAIHHHHKRKRILQKKKHSPSKIKLIKFVDKLVYIIGAIALLMTLPQILKIWINQNSTGVSLISWATYLFTAGFWVFYGIIHKAKPIIVIYSMAILLDFLIVLGIILYR